LEGKHSSYEEPVANAKEKYVYYNLVKASAEAGDNNFTEALATLDDIMEVVPGSPEANMLRLQTLNNMKNYDGVIASGDAAAAVQTTPEAQSNAYFLVGAAYQNKENAASAIEYYKKVTDGPSMATAKAQITELAKVLK
jgi:tetratricopeptide (TPR) repeat protein